MEGLSQRVSFFEPLDKERDRSRNASSPEVTPVDVPKLDTRSVLMRCLVVDAETEEERSGAARMS